MLFYSKQKSIWKCQDYQINAVNEFGTNAHAAHLFHMIQNY